MTREDLSLKCEAFEDRSVTEELRDDSSTSEAQNNKPLLQLNLNLLTILVFEFITAAMN